MDTDVSADDYLEIAHLMNAWMYRDLGQWEQLLDLFHPQGEIEITWYKGSATGFVEGSRRMSQGPLRSLHVFAWPLLQFSDDGQRAISLTRASIVAQCEGPSFGASTQARMFDRLEKHNGAWKIRRRQAVYDMSHFTFLSQPEAMDVDKIRRHPEAYAALAYLLETAGFPVQGHYPTAGSEAERAITLAAGQWLSGEAMGGRGHD